MKEQCIFAGFGGQGMLLIGKFLAEAGMETGKHVSWLPSYGPEMRGGTANCSVVVSDKPVASPLIAQADTILAMNKPSLLKFEGDVKPGGLLLINSSIIDIKTSRTDVEAVYVPCNEIAESVGNLKGPNVVFLGAYVAKKPEVISKEAIIEAMRVELGEKKARFLDGNIKALEAGMAYVHEHYGA
ncbi:MAG TPA: 2-oxoacid:acceptor oxidoreductase family protein [Candidatus Scatomorpha stercoravium]|nr:2-oxoacid:acceptor oxidoreductase family protein [Candidatus Scatomorpha stercoravium]